MISFLSNKQLPQNFIVINSGNSVFFVKYDQIVFLKAESNYTHIFLIDGRNYTVCKTLKVFEEELAKMCFLRCHKSFLVNIYYISEIQKGNHDCIFLSNGTKIPISRRHVRMMRQIFHSEKQITIN